MQASSLIDDIGGVFMRRQQLKAIVMALCGIILLLFVGACSLHGNGQTGDHSVVLTEKDRNTSVEISVGDEIIIRLESSPSTGYEWKIVSVDEGMLKTEKVQQVSPSPVPGEKEPAVGQGTITEFRIRALQKGTSVLLLTYARNWETNVPPLKTFQVQVVVR